MQLNLVSRYLIYALIDSKLNIRYIGKSTSGMKRPKAHQRPSYMKKNAHWPVIRWIKKLRESGLDFNIQILQEFRFPDNTTKEERDQVIFAAEKRFIAEYRSKQPKGSEFELLNITDGGEGASGHKMSDEQKENLRQANLGNTHSKGKKKNLSQEEREDMAKRARERSANPEVRAKISKTLTGKRQSPETIQKRNKSRKANNKPRPLISEETRLKMSLARLGKSFGPMSEEGKANIRKAQVGRKHSEETKRKISSLQTGKKRTSPKMGKDGLLIIDENGNLYKNAIEAAQKMGCSQTGVLEVLKGQRNSCYGHIFRYIKKEEV